MAGSSILKLELDFSEPESIAIGSAISSEETSAGGHLWRVHVFKRGVKEEDKGQFVSIFLKLVSKSKNVKAIFQVFVLRKDSEVSVSHEKTCVHVFSTEGSRTRGWYRFKKLSDIVSNGWATLLFSIIVVEDDNIDLPSSATDVGWYLGQLLDCNVGTDVSFMVNGETIPAHRVVLAARSPVFKAAVFGSTADATSQTITVKDIEPSVFKAMLWFMYTDGMPEDDELGDSPTEMLQQLLAAADRYQVDELKLMSARWLWDRISVDTFGSTIVCAEMYNCPELKDKCIDFFASENNFKKIMFTDGFVGLVQNFPSLAAKLKERIGA